MVFLDRRGALLPKPNYGADMVVSGGGVGKRRWGNSQCFTVINAFQLKSFLQYYYYYYYAARDKESCGREEATAKN